MNKDTQAVLYADDNLVKAIEDYQTAVVLARPASHKGFSMALEDASADTTSEAKKTMWGRFKEWFNRILNWFKQRFSKKQKVQIEEVVEIIDKAETDWAAKAAEETAAWMSSLDELRKASEKAAKAQVDEIVKTAKENAAKVELEKIKGTCDIIFNKFKGKVEEAVVAVYNDKMASYGGVLVPIIDSAAVTDSTLSNLGNSSILRDINNSLNSLNTAIKMLLSGIAVYMNQPDKLREATVKIGNTRLKEHIAKLQIGGEKKELHFKDAVTLNNVIAGAKRLYSQVKGFNTAEVIQSIEKTLDVLKERVNNVSDEEAQSNPELADALGAIREMISTTLIPAMSSTSLLSLWEGMIVNALGTLVNLPTFAKNDITSNTAEIKKEFIAAVTAIHPEAKSSFISLYFGDAVIKLLGK